MKKVNIKRSIEIASLAISSLGLSLIGFASSVHAAGTTYYWAGNSSNLAGDGTGLNASHSLDLTATSNWSNSATTYDNSNINTGFQNGSYLVFNVTGSITTTGTFTGTNVPAGIELKSGDVTINASGGSFNMAPGAIVKSDTASASLEIGGLTDALHLT